MCSHYQALKKQEHLRKFFDAESPPAPGKADVWPGYLGTFIRRHPHADVGDAAVPAAEALNGLFGLVPHWASDTKITRYTYNARSESVADKPSFRDAFKGQQRCIVPMDAFYEPDWRSGKAVATRIASVNGEPLGVAGLWSSWKSSPGEWVHSFTLLTINADAHPLMQQFHKPTDEKRMLVILAPQRYHDWLQPHVDVQEFLRPYPAERLQAQTPDAAQGVLIE